MNKKIVVAVGCVILSLPFFYYFAPGTKDMRTQSLEFEYRPLVGDHVTYKVSHNLKINGGKFLQFSGLLHETVVGRDEKNYIYEISLEDAEGNLPYKVFMEMKGPLYLLVSENRKILKMFSPSSLSTDALNALKALVFATQAVLPSKENNVGGEWSLNEEDGLGTHKAYYQIKRGKIWPMVSKRRERPKNIKILPGSFTSIKFNPAVKNIQKIEQVEIFEKQTPLNTLKGELKTKILFMTKGRNQLAESKTLKEIESLYERNHYAISYKEYTGESNKIEEAITLSTLFRDASEIDFKHDGAKSYDFYRKLGKLLKEDRNHIPRLFKKVRTFGGNDKNREKISYFLGPLSYFKAEEIQEEFIEFIKNTKDKVVWEQAIKILVDLKLPSEEVKNFLMSIYSSDPKSWKRNIALLGLGTLSYKANSSLATATVLNLVDLFKKESNEQNKARIISAMGNSGHRDILNVIAPLLNDEKLEMRSQAIFALRYVKGSDVDKIFENTLLNDDKSEVKSRALKALHYRKGRSKNEIVKKFFKNEKTENLRIEALHVLDSSSLKVRFLKWVEQNDESSMVREEAQNILLTLDD